MMTGEGSCDCRMYKSFSFATSLEAVSVLLQDWDRQKFGSDLPLSTLSTTLFSVLLQC